jgi:hypothetical protein
MLECDKRGISVQWGSVQQMIGTMENSELKLYELIL